MTHINNSNNLANGADAPFEKCNLELLVKSAGSIKERLGACLFCQEFWMELHALHQMGKVNLEVTIVPAISELLKQFEGGQLPILIDKQNAKAYTDNHELERRIFQIAKQSGVYLFDKDPAVERVIEGLYKNFKSLLGAKMTPNSVVAPSGAERKLKNQLNEINELLKQRGTRYLLHDQMLEYDCELMPRLHHIRIAGENLAHFEIPHDLVYLWNYLLTAYRTVAFRESCPSDQDILSHYRQQLLPNDPVSRRVSIQTPVTTLSVPDDVLNAIKKNPITSVKQIDQHFRDFEAKYLHA